MITILLVLLTVALIMFVAAMVFEETWMFITGVVIFVFIATVAFTYASAYKTGQIDAMTGKIKYELVTQPDSTKTWEPKE